MPGFRWTSPAFSAKNAARRAYLFISITLLGGFHPQLGAQEVAAKAPPLATSSQQPLPDSPGQTQFPIAKLIPLPGETTLVQIDSATQSESGGVYVLDGMVRITYKDRIVEADHIEYDGNTDEVTATGHLTITGGSNHEIIHASHGILNLKSQTGRFYDVTGSVGVKTSTGMKMTYVNSNPFLFSGRVVVKTGPEEYEVFDGTVTSCQLKKPDWILSAAHLSFDGEKARAKNSTFHLLNIPLLYLPYVTHPVDAEDRQSGLLIPVISQSSTKGLVIGEQIYFALNRSTDLTVGAAYYSSVGWEQSALFRWKGAGNNFVTARYSGVLDRKPPGPTNQGGEDVLFSGRRDLSEKSRVSATVEYLSSYIYREAFTPNFNQAVTSDVVSTVYAVRQSNGIEVAAEADRYQGIKVVQSLTAAGQQVHIFHAPSLEVSTTDHTLGVGNLQWSFEASAAGLKRTQPNFTSGGIVERFDLHPELAFPFGLPGGWRFRPSVAARETIYTRSRVTPYVPTGPVQSDDPLSRSDVEAKIDIRPPAIERTFELKGRAARLFGPELKHTIEPQLVYRYTNGVENFLNVLRFDQADVVADTNEAEYGVTQHIYLRPKKRGGCNTAAVSQSPGLNTEDSAVDADEADDKSGHCPNEEWISWRLTHKYFFDQIFGGAVTRGRRNILDSTLSFSGVAFLTEPRETSPILSRMRVRTSAKTDIEWDFDYDPGAKKFNSNNLFVDLHQGAAFGALSYARLDAPGRFYTQGTSSAISNFNQLRVLMGYGMPTKPGLSLAANAGIDLDAGTNVTTTVAATPTTPATTTTTFQSLLQYAALQGSYNWNCCGVSLEYRKYELGSVRNEGVYRFNFTLVNIGTAGNLKRAERLF